MEVHLAGQAFCRGGSKTSLVGRAFWNTHLVGCAFPQQSKSNGFLNVAVPTVNDRVLESFIDNMGKHAIPEIHGYLWRPKHTSHLPCNEYTNTLEDVVLQLGFPMDGPIVITGLAIILGKVHILGHRYPYMLHPHAGVDVKPHVRIGVDICTVTNGDIDSNAHAAVDDNVDVRYLSDARTKQQSTIEENDDTAKLEEMIAEWAMLGTYSGDDDDDEKVYKHAPLDTPPNAPPVVPSFEPPIARKNLLCNHRPPPCSTHSPRRHD
uniref:Uncharacterized protein n=1 Tax=Gossypium hirsutum TaxID=3635 RepID=I3NMW1_GOSHI|nr:hypothetical protein [Gossypium hirsutum]